MTLTTLILITLTIGATTAQNSLVLSCPSIYGCVNCAANSTSCSQCNYNILIILQNNTCVRYTADPNCRKINSDGVCIACKRGYILDTNSVCTAAPQTPGCIVHDTRGRAQGCLYYVSTYTMATSGTYVERIPNCETYSTDLLYCQVCKSGYSVVNAQQCVLTSSLVANCTSYDSSYACLACAFNYAVKNGQCVKDIANCQTLTTNADPNLVVCASCNTGYYQLLGLCEVQNIANCGLYASNLNKCLMCNSGYFVSGDICQPQSVANCKTYVSGKNECQECLSGHYLNSTSCLAQSLTGCSVYLANQNVCQTCSNGYSLANGSCSLVTITNCQTYVPTSPCARSVILATT